MIDFAQPCDLVSPVGTLLFNEPMSYSAGEGTLLLLPQRSVAVAPLRNQQARQNLPHFDGSSQNDRWFEGYIVSLALQFWNGNLDEPACDELLQQMDDTLMYVLRSLPRAATVSSNRFRFTPAGESRRIIDSVKLLREAQPSIEAQKAVEVSFVIDSEFPYAIDLTQTQPSIAGSHTNGGTAKFYPVILVDSGTSAFTITNTTNGDVLEYSGVAIGGSYGEYNAFRGTFFQDGDDAALIAGIVPTSASKEFGLDPGANTITVSGATGSMLLNDAWA